MPAHTTDRTVTVAAGSECRLRSGDDHVLGDGASPLAALGNLVGHVAVGA